MKKKLVALLMSVTMVSGSMALPVYAESEEAVVEFSADEEETADLEMEDLESQEEFSAEVPQEFSDAGGADFADHVDEELFSSEMETVGEGRASGGNINWGSSDSILPTDVTTASDGCALLGVKGSYITDMRAALDRVNAIRKEACEEGVPDPRNSSRKLTSSDYVPIKWSSDLEYIARIRAAEASLVLAHTRPNGTRCFTLNSPNGIRSYGEVLAWNNTRKFLPGIEQWYEEKEDWVNQNNNAVTGHYTEMIDPANQYVGYATFINPDARYSTTTSGEYNKYDNNLDESFGPDISNCTQTIEAQTSDITVGMSDFEELQAPNSVQADFYANITNSSCNLSVLDNNVSWKSSNTSVATVDAKGLVTGVQAGNADITAALSSLSATKMIKVAAAVHEHSWDAGKVTTEATCTTDGVKTYTCSVCKTTKTETIKATGHKMGEWKTVTAATTQKEGKQERTCTACDYKETKSIPKLPVKKGTFKVTPSKTAVTYNGKAQKPSVTVYAGNKKLSSKYYTVSYRNNTAVGTATITVTGKGNYQNYSGKTTFRINLQKTTLFALKSSRKGELQATWKKTSGNTGYQIQYATNAKFSGAKVKNTTRTNYTIKGLKSKGRYYVRVRTYKKVGGKYWYSGWSNVRNIRIK